MHTLTGERSGAVQLYLAGTGLWRYVAPLIGGGIPNWKPYILESFYYADKDEIQKLMPYFGDFLLDSGAFTFMGGFSFTENKNKRVVWEEYIDKYCNFINTYKVEKFFELDIDSVVGYEQVKKYRDLIEKKTCRQVIPVWHSNRGKDEFLRMCDEYPYVALGGIVGGEWSAKAEKYIPWFISEAHKRGAKIHGLGFTKLEKLKHYHFDSVDSTSWTIGNRFGYVYKFNGHGIDKVSKPNGTRVPKDKVRELAVHNFVEWVKFQQWADAHL